MPTVSPLSGPPSRSPASPSMFSVPPFIPEPANGPASPRMVNCPPDMRRPASTPTSPSTRIEPAVMPDADAIETRARRLR